MLVAVDRLSRFAQVWATMVIVDRSIGLRNRSADSHFAGVKRTGFVKIKSENQAKTHETA